jgi:TATA-binding protein-associated factor
LQIRLYIFEHLFAIFMWPSVKIYDLVVIDIARVLQEDALQQPAAEALAEVIVQCLGRKPSPNEKLVRNLCCLVCADPLETPKVNQANQSAVNAQEIDVPNAGKGIKNLKMSSLSAMDERAKFEGAITRRGAESALRSLSEKFKSSLFDQLPKLWDCLTEALGEPSTAAIGASQPSDPCSVWTSDSQALITNLQVVPFIPVMSYPFS